MVRKVSSASQRKLSEVAKLAGSWLRRELEHGTWKTTSKSEERQLLIGSKRALALATPFSAPA